MIRIWGKLMKKNRFLQDATFTSHSTSLSLMERIDESIDFFTMDFDIQKPMWFDKNTKELDKFGKTEFYADQFIESVDFDYFEIEIIENDEDEV